MEVEKAFVIQEEKSTRKYIHRPEAVELFRTLETEIK